MVLALMVSIGLHTVVIQSVAWAGMVVSYSLEKGSLGQGMADTFDGQHACPLCKLAKQTSEKQADADDKPAPVEEGLLKLHLMTQEMPRIVFTAPAPQDFLAAPEPLAVTLAVTPATPPPRGAFLG